MDGSTEKKKGRKTKRGPRAETGTKTNPAAEVNSVEVVTFGIPRYILSLIVVTIIAWATDRQRCTTAKLSLRTRRDENPTPRILPREVDVENEAIILGDNRGKPFPVPRRARGGGYRGRGKVKELTRETTWSIDPIDGEYLRLWTSVF